MVAIINENCYLYQTTAFYCITERKDRYEINSEASEEIDKLRDVALLYQWIRSIGEGVIKGQVLASPVGAETIYVLKRPTRVTLEYDSNSMAQRGKPKFPLRG